jgi:hypothetical protein
LSRYVNLLLTFLVLSYPILGRAETVNSDLSKGLPDQVGPYRARGPVAEAARSENAPLELSTASGVTRTYSSPGGPIFVALYQADDDTEAYALFTALTQGDLKLGDVGTASVEHSGRFYFFKGRHVVALEAQSRNKPVDLPGLAREIANGLDRGDNDIPVLLRHLPNWETARNGSRYITSFRSLKALFPDQPVLDVVSFEAGAESVIANYDGASLVIIEFTTPQHAGDNDRFIKAKLSELAGLTQATGTQKAPTAYRRVGNYAVFVFNGSDKQAAENLINEVKYEQVTQWLGDNPYPLLEAQHKYVTTTLGVLVSVVKSTGIALLVCLSVGGVFGGLLFLRRRAQQRAVEAYSDAGGMLRLNLDELTPETDSARLLGPGR